MLTSCLLIFFKAVETGYQKEVDGEVGPRQVPGSAPDRAMAPLLSLQRRRQHMELRDTASDQEIRGRSLM